MAPCRASGCIKTITSEVTDLRLWGCYSWSMESFPDLLRHWRRQRRFSQLDLATEAGVSSRHISFLETGRSRPSREMIVHLGDVLTVPFDIRNQMLGAAGFAAKYPARPLDDEAMAPVVRAINWTLERHAPRLGIAIDGLWVIKRMNAPARRLFRALGAAEGISMIELLLRPEVQASLENWPEVARHSAMRLRAENNARGHVPELSGAADLFARHGGSDQSDGPTIPTVFKLAGQRLSLFGTIAHFSTTADQTV